MLCQYNIIELKLIFRKKMPRDKKKYLLDDEKKIKLLQESRIINLATINKNGLPHLVPMWFILDANNEINFTSYHKSQKIINLKRDNRIVIMIEGGTHYEELHGLVLEGQFGHSQDRKACQPPFHLQSHPGVVSVVGVT